MLNIFYKKAAVLFLTAAFLLPACAIYNKDNYGKLTFYNSIDKSSFSFVVSDEFNQENNKSPSSKNHPKMTKAEAKLLSYFLKKNNYCINKKGELSFAVTSKQEKIYDVTFLSVIEQNYNAKPLTPAIFFGECLP